MNREDDTKCFSIQMAAQMSGLSAHTIRAWEKRYQAIKPSRADNGRRLYSSQEVERLTLLSQLTNLGSSISQIAELTDSELKSIQTKLITSRNGAFFSTTPEVKPVFTIEQTKQLLIQAVRGYQVDAISMILGEAKLALPPKDLALSVLEPLLAEVKELAKSQAIKHAQVQALQALIKFHAGTLVYSHYEKNVKSPTRIVLTTMEKNHYTLDILLGALLCCHYSHNFYYLSASLPAPSIVEALRATESNILILGICTTLPDATLKVNIEEMMAQLPQKTQVFLMGAREPFPLTWKNCRFVGSNQELDKLLTEI